MLSFLKQNLRWIAGGFLLTFMSSFGQTFFISASVGDWQEKFGLSHGGFGFLYMAATICSALTLPFLGKIVDFVPAHRVIAFSMPMLALAMAGAAFAPSILLLGVAICLLRLFGQGMMTHIALTTTGRWFAATRGRAVSLVVLGHQGGEAALPLLFAATVLAAGLQAGWLAGAALLVFVVMPIAIWAYSEPRMPAGQSAAHASSSRQWTRGEVFRDPVFWALLTGVLAPPFIGTTIFFHQDYLTVLHGWPAQLFAIGMTAMALTTVCFALITGALIDRFGAVSVLPYFLFPLTFACILGGLTGSPPAFFGFMVLIGVSYGFSSTLFGALWPEIYGTQHLGAVRSAIVAFSVLATASGPGVTGALIDAGMGLPSQLLLLAAYCGFAILMMAAASRTLRRRLPRAAPAIS